MADLTFAGRFPYGKIKRRATDVTTPPTEPFTMRHSKVSIATIHSRVYDAH